MSGDWKVIWCKFPFILAFYTTNVYLRIYVHSVSKDDNTRESQDLLGRLGLCTLLAELLKKYLESSDVCASVCRAIVNICYTHAANKAALLDADILTLLETCLRKHLYSEKATRYAVCAIAELNVDGDSVAMAERARALEDIGRLIIDAMEKYIDSHVLIQAGCMAIVSLKHLNLELGQARACELIAAVLLRSNNQSETVSQWCLRAVGSLARCLENRIRFHETNICELICSSLSYHIGSENILSVMLMRDTSSVYVAQYGCDAVYYLTRSQSDAAFFQTKFGTLGACESISKALLKYSEIDIVACACIRAMVVLCRGNLANSTKFGYLGCCPSVVECLRNFPSSAEVAVWGCRGITSLTQDGLNNIGRLVGAGVCEAIPVSLQAHQVNPGVAGAGAESIAAILDAADDSLNLAARFGRSGACDALISVIKNHRDQPLVIEKACRAVVSLSKLHGNSGWFGATGFLEGILSAQAKHAENYLVSASCFEALGGLCVDENNRSKLLQNGTCELLLDSFLLHIQFVETAFAGSFAIESMCEAKDEKLRRVRRYNKPARADIDGDHSADITEPASDQSFTRSSFLDAIIGGVEDDDEAAGKGNNTTDTSHEQFMLQHPSKDSGAPLPSPRSQDSFALSEDHDHDEAKSADAPRGGVAGTESPPSRKLSIVDDEVSQSVLFLRSRRTAKGIFFRGGVHFILVTALSIHYPDARAVCQISRAIAKLCQGAGGNKHPDRAAFGFFKGPEALVRALRHHSKSEEVVHWSCLAITELVRDSKENKISVRLCGGLELIVQGLRRHRRSSSNLCPRLVEAAANTIYHLAINDAMHKDIFGKAGAVETLLDALEAHLRNSETAYSCCLALYQICYGQADNIALLAASGSACNVLTIVLNKYYDVKNLAAACLSLLALYSSSATSSAGGNQTALQHSGLDKVLPVIWQRYERMDFLAILMSCQVTAVCFQSPQMKLALGQTLIVKSLWALIEKRLDALLLSPRDDHNFKKQIAADGISLQSFMPSVQFLDNFLFDASAAAAVALAKESASASLRPPVPPPVTTHVSALTDDADWKEFPAEPDASSISQFNAHAELFSPRSIHSSLTGVAGLTALEHQRLPFRAGSDILSTANSRVTEDDLVFEEALRAFGSLLIDSDVNKARLLTTHSHILPELRRVAGTDLRPHLATIERLQRQLSESDIAVTDAYFTSSLDVLLHNQYIVRVVCMFHELYTHLITKAK